MTDRRAASSAKSFILQGPHEHGRSALRRWMPGAGVGCALLVSAVLGPGPTSAASSATVEVASNSTYGEILVSSAGLPLYTLDTDHSGESTCGASCLEAWPPLEVSAATVPSAGPGVPGSLGTALQADGSTFVTYDGVPLYTFAGDSPGAVTGQGVAGFSVVRIEAQGTGPATTFPEQSPTPTTSATPGGATAAAGSQDMASAGSGGATPGSATTAGSPPAATVTAQVAAQGSSTTAEAGPTGGSPAALASTGPGGALSSLVLVGAILFVSGALLRFGAEKHRRRRSFARAGEARRAGKGDHR